MRRTRGLSRERLGALAGVSPRTIYAIEVEGVIPQRATVAVLSAALACRPQDLTINDCDPSVRPGRRKQGERTAHAREYPAR
jgi:DNA-binding XRE family transcriptional regulator